MVKSVDLTLKLLEAEWESMRECKILALIGLDNPKRDLVASQYDSKLANILKKIVTIEETINN